VLSAKTKGDEAHNVTSTDAANLADAPICLVDSMGDNVEKAIFAALGPGGDVHFGNVSENLGLEAKGPGKDVDGGDRIRWYEAGEQWMIQSEC
jgi:hypothetical protein